MKKDRAREKRRLKKKDKEQPVPPGRDRKQEMLDRLAEPVDTVPENAEEADAPAPECSRPAENLSPLRTACYIDFENIFYTIKKHGHLICIPKMVRLLNRLSRDLSGEGFMKTAVYANWDSIVPEQRHAQDDWNMMGWRTIGVPTRENYRSSRHIKNLVDFIMSLDMLEDVYTLNNDVYFIVSGDNDFVEAVERLKRKGRKAVVVSMRPNLSFRLQEAADEYIIFNYDEITGDEPLPVDTYQRLTRQPPENRQSRGREADDEFQILRMAVEGAEKDLGKTPVLWKVVRDEYFLRDTRMSSQEANDFVQSLETAGFVTLEKKMVPGKGSLIYISLPRYRGL